MTDFWKNKLLAYLHDPPSKCLDLGAHTDNAATLMRAAGFTDEEINTYNRPADHTASSADRLPFPESRASGLSCAFDGVRAQFHHPLGGGSLPFPKEFITADLAFETDQTIQPVCDVSALPADEQWRARFFAHWRLYARNARERDHRFAFLPADTRLPDHTVWTHMQVVSALAGCATGEAKDSPLAPAFLKFQLSGVQEFIAQARSTRDLWSGSYLLSWLMAAGLKALSAEIGPDAVIFPSLQGQPVFDLHWRDQLWERVKIGNKSVWESLKAEDRQQLTPNLPNVFLAVVPAGRAAEVGDLVEKAIRKEWQRIADAVWNFCDAAIVDTKGNRNLTSDEGALSRAARVERFDAQVKRFLSVAWQIIEWPGSLAQALALADQFAGDMPVAKARERVQSVVDMATKQMPVEHRDARYYSDAAKTNLNNVGLGWSAILAFTSWSLDAVRQTRAFPAWAEGGWQIGAGNNKDALNGRDEAVAGGQEWFSRCEKLGGAWASLFKKADWLGAVTLIKRVWHLAYLKDVWHLNTESRYFPMPSTRSVGAHRPDAGDDELDPDTGSEDRHFAVLALDGDEIGKCVSGEKSPSFASQLADYRDGSGVQRYGAKSYFEKSDFEGFLEKQRPLSPSYHLQFSEALSNFALLCARPVVEAFDGRLIYAGGDDVLALVPADTALACAAALRAAFRGDANLGDMLKHAALQVPERGRNYLQRLAVEKFLLSSPRPGFVFSGDRKPDYSGISIPFVVPGPRAEVSVGIAVAHFKAPLQDVVRAAQAAEKRAKKMPGKAAVAVSLFKRSGEVIEWSCKWDSGGLELYQSLLEHLVAGHLSSKFPHRVVELLEPYLLSRSGLYTMERASHFDGPAVITLEFAHVLDRQAQVRGEEKRQLISELAGVLDAYLKQFGEASRDPVPDLIGLCQTVAFANRTSPNSPADLSASSVISTPRTEMQPL